MKLFCVINKIKYKQMKNFIVNNDSKQENPVLTTLIIIVFKEIIRKSDSCGWGEDIIPMKNKRRRIKEMKEN